MSEDEEGFTSEEHEWISERVFALWTELIGRFPDRAGAQCSAALTVAANLAAMSLECVKDESKAKVRRQFLDVWDTAEEVMAKRMRHLRRRKR